MRLVNTLASSLAVSLQNARLFDETKRLFEAERQRVAELQTISSVQQALAKELELHALIDVVGSKIRETFSAANTFVALYDAATQMVQFPFYVGCDGQPVHVEPYALGDSLTCKVIRSRQPLVLGTAAETVAAGAVLEDDGVKEMPESWLGVPMISGNDVVGVVALQDWPKNRYGENDVRLLSTLASSLAGALQNARLFEAERQRAAELAIINSVQQGLASRLDFQGIIDLVGNKIQEVFDVHCVTIYLYNSEHNLLIPSFAIERGKHIGQEPFAPEHGLTAHVLHTRQPVVINEHLMERGAELGAIIVPGTEAPRSYVGVPISL